MTKREKFLLTLQEVRDLVRLIDTAFEFHKDRAKVGATDKAYLTRLKHLRQRARRLLADREAKAARE